MREVLSLGAGVQSTTVLLMSCLGELPRLDCAIFADTGWEPKAVYKHLDWLESTSLSYGIPVYKVSIGNIRDIALNAVNGQGKKFIGLPVFTKEEGDKREGRLRRQCTREFKIFPVQTFIRRIILGIKPKAKAPTKCCRMWMGISADEKRRMRQSKQHWYDYYYPLIEKDLTRSQCLDWISSKGFPLPPRSSCIGCPYHSNTKWWYMKRDNPDEFRDAVDFDSAIRHGTKNNKKPVYIHRSCKPLGEIDFDKLVDESCQQDGCDDGYCGV